MHCDPNNRDAENATALHPAGHLDIVKFLIFDQNCDLDIPGHYSRTPPHYAAELGHIHIVKSLPDMHARLQFVMFG